MAQRSVLIKSGNPQQAFDTIEKIRCMLSLHTCRERTVVKAQKLEAAKLVALLSQSIPLDLRQRRARSELPVLAGWLRKFLTPSSHKNYPGGRALLASFVGKSLSHIESVLREQYVPNKNRDFSKQRQ